MLLLLFPLLLHSFDPRLNTLFTSLDPRSVPQHLTLYHLYPESDEGQKALQIAWELLGGEGSAKALPPTLEIEQLTAALSHTPQSHKTHFTPEQLALIQHLGRHLPNRKLPGHQARTEEEVLALNPGEIDIARALLITLGEEESHYEAMLDLMALQILARLSPTAPYWEKVAAITHFVFHEMQFRFPPHSLYATAVDTYTFLPSVLEAREGVCLGVSLLYLALGQRLDVPLEIVTPPGHIYVRCNQGNQILNIETTARGVHIPTEHYLGLDESEPQLRNYKEAIGLSHMNEAALFWQRQEPQKAIAAYRRAQPFLPEDPLLTEFLAYQYLLAGDETRGRQLLSRVSEEPLPADYLAGHVDTAGIQALFQTVDETRTSIESKQHALLATLAHFPHFRSGHFALAVTYLQLHRHREALATLEHYLTLAPDDPTAHYYAAALSAERNNLPAARSHLTLAEKHSPQHNPKPLRDLRRQLK